RERVADVAELPERAAARAGLLGDLPQGGLLAALAGVDLALREGPEPRRAAAGPDRRHHPAPTQAPDEDTAGGEFTPHGGTRTDRTLVLRTQIVALCCCRWHSPTPSAKCFPVETTCHQ